MDSSQEMLNRSIAAFSDDGRLSVDELDHIVSAGLADDGELDNAEKEVLFKVLSKLTAADFSPELWNRVESLIRKYELDGAA